MYATGPAAGQYAQYGATSAFGEPQGDGGFQIPVPKKANGNGGRRYTGNHWAAMAAGLFLPWLVFAILVTVESTSIHYTSSSVVTLVVLLMVVAVFGAAGLAVRAWLKRRDGHDPSWYIFLAVTGLIAVVLGIYIGDWNYESNMEPYEDINQLNIYKGIDPSIYVGTQLMDAGQIYFAPQAYLDTTFAMGFQNVDTYCVVPISMANTNSTNVSKVLMTYDFWAVGLNCCSGHQPDFYCGEYSNPKAKAGLRLMREELRSYFRLAVQQAEAAFNIHSSHPIFLEWMEDPTTEISAYLDDAYKYMLIAIGCYFGFQVFLVVLGVLIFSKTGGA